MGERRIPIKNMSPLNKKTIDEKLFKLQEYIKILEELHGKGRAVFFADRIVQDATTGPLIEKIILL